MNPSGGTDAPQGARADCTLGGIVCQLHACDVYECPQSLVQFEAFPVDLFGPDHSTSLAHLQQPCDLLPPYRILGIGTSAIRHQAPAELLPQALLYDLDIPR